MLLRNIAILYMKVSAQTPIHKRNADYLPYHEQALHGLNYLMEKPALVAHAP